MSTIYILKAQNKENKFEFSLGAYKNKQTAYKHLQIQEEVTGNEYNHWIEEDTLLDD